MSEHKNYCPIHHLYYSGTQCPLCEKERINRMVEKFEKSSQASEKKIEKVREINEDDLTKLVNKFNIR